MATDANAGGNVLEPRAVTRDLFSATIGSIACCYVGQPFDTVKVRMQTNPDQFSGVVSSTTSILRNEVRGPKCLCRGRGDRRAHPDEDGGGGRRRSLLIRIYAHADCSA